MRFHVLSLPHTVTSKDYLSCAFTQKVLKFCKMMKDPKHTIIHYGHERSDVVCDEHVTVMTDEVLEKAYGKYDFKKEFFKHNSSDIASKTFNENALKEMKNRAKPKDFILCFWGVGHKPISDGF